MMPCAARSTAWPIIPASIAIADATVNIQPTTSHPRELRGGKSDDSHPDKQPDGAEASRPTGSVGSYRLPPRLSATPFAVSSSAISRAARSPPNRAVGISAR